VKVFIFVGPTLSRAEAEAELSATYLPPVAHGDVLRAVRERPFAIGIIDGYFERQPAVWHKEILWALTQGIHVLGAASMGALRAAELEAFGMKGVGAVFESFRSGSLEDDDEVAVAHGDASTGYRATSEAMVNIRATLHAAEDSGIVPAGLRVRLEGLAKSLFYPDRSYPRIFAAALEEGVARPQVDALRTFVANRRVDRKRLDAIELLSALRTCISAAAPPRPVAYSLSNTEAWTQVVDWAESQPPLTEDTASVDATMIAAEARLSGAAGRVLVKAALNRALAGTLAQRDATTGHSERVEALDRRLRTALGERSEQAFSAWLVERDLTTETYRHFLERCADLEGAKKSVNHLVDRHLVDEARMTGEYARLSQRARDKAKLLENHGLGEPTLQDAELTAEALMAWYLERIEVAASASLDETLVDFAFADRAALLRDALREFLYHRIAGSTQ
jgi:hypothetical protein